LTARTVLVPQARVVRWFDNFAERHGGSGTSVVRSGALVATAPDGAVAAARLPFSRPYVGPPDPADFAEAISPPARWGVLLVRKGGFAVAALEGSQVVESKVGRRHVQGRTKAGGQSQQRFARRRDNQARQAYEAAAGHAARIVADVEALVCGGDRRAVEAVLDDPRLRRASARQVPPWLDVPDPRRDVLDRAVSDATAAIVELTEPD
jgi:Actinobacteria/chloroflexi VLRF1 release factor